MDSISLRVCDPYNCVNVLSYDLIGLELIIILCYSSVIPLQRLLENTFQLDLQAARE